MTQNERIRAARTALVARFPYLYPVAYLLSLVESEMVPTMAVDRRARLYYNPRFVDALTDTQLVGLLWHEIHHILREHVGPRGEELKKHPQGNIALDLEINDDAEEAGVDLPRPPHPYGGYFPQDLGLPRGLLAEEYLELLSQWPSPPPQGGSMDQHGPGPWEEEEGGEEGVNEGTLEVARRAVAQKAKEYEAKGRGTLPSGMRRWVDQILNPQVDWRSVLRRMVKGTIAHHLGKKRPTYTKPNRRGHAYHPVIMPGHYGLKPKVAIVVDTSGSMGERELAQALGEIQGILRLAKVTVISTDAAAHTAQKVFRPEQITLMGGGGTDMIEGIKKAEELRPDIIIVITDGDTPWPTKRPKATTLAVIIGNHQQPPPFIPHITIP